MPKNNGITPTEIFLNAPLYKKNAKKVAREVEDFNSTLDMYCLMCRKDSVFKRYGYEPRPTAASAPPMTTGRGSIIYLKPELPLPRTFSVEFECSRDKNHRAIFIFRLDEKSFVKFGEFPSRADRQYPEIRRFERELGRYYEELKTALHLYTHNIGIGSFIYLRRVLEKVVNDAAVCKYSNQAGWSLEEWKKGMRRFDDEIKDLADELPKFLVKNQVLYKILSKGIHELDEKECQDYFEIVRSAIEEILDERMSRDEKEKRQSLVSSKLSQIQSNLRKEH